MSEILLDFIVEEVYNKTIEKRQKPRKQTGIESFPDNYDLTHWVCLKVTRLKDNQVFTKDTTKTDKGVVLHIKIINYQGGYKKCMIGTCSGDYALNDLIIVTDNMVQNPIHYGGEQNPYEAIKIIEAHELDFHLGNAIKYILRAGKKDDIKQDLEKSIWYLQRKIDRL